MSLRASTLIALVTATLAFSIFVTSRVSISSDSMWAIPLAKSIITDGDLWLDEHRAVAKSKKNYGLRRMRGRKVSHLYSFFPFGTAFLITPAVWLYEQSPESLCKLLPRAGCENPSALTQRVELEKVFASAIVSLSGLMLFIATRRCAGSAPALATLLCFYFLTPSWSLVSRGLWQHGPSILMLSASLVLLTSPRWGALSGIPLGWSYLIRPTNALSVLLVGIYLALTTGVGKAVKYALLVALPVGVLVLWSVLNLKQLLPPYYSGSRLSLGPELIHGIGVNLISPSRGLLWFVPILLVGAFSKNRTLWSDPLNRTVAATVLLHLLAISAFPEWWAGDSFGPRYMSDMLPYLFFLFAQLLAGMRCDRWISRLTITAVIAFSFFIHSQGASRLELWMWNRYPRDITIHPERVWEFKDSQWMRAFRG